MVLSPMRENGLRPWDVRECVYTIKNTHLGELALCVHDKQAGFAAGTVTNHDKLARDRHGRAEVVCGCAEGWWCVGRR